MSSGAGGATPPNWFALVTYIPEPLSSFLDDLRRELVPAYAPRAHVTILPPRPLAVTTGTVVEKLNAEVVDLTAFEIEARSVEIFPNTAVIYIGLSAGRGELQRIHDRLNNGPLGYDEPYPYCPHITLAQDLRPEEVPHLFEKARRHWSEFQGDRSFPAGTMTFVKSTNQNSWLDLAHWSLNAVSSVR